MLCLKHLPKIKAHFLEYCTFKTTVLLTIEKKKDEELSI